MGKDFRVGLMTGVVLAGAALVWVATRPSLSPRARLAPAGAASPKADPAAAGSFPWESVDAPESTPVNPPGPSQPSASEEFAGLQRLEEPQSLPTHQQVAPSEPAVQPTGPDLTIHELDEPIKTTRFHIVRKNETLSAIAQQYYGSQDKWRKIVAANQTVIKDPNRIAPGTKLTIPE